MSFGLLNPVVASDGSTCSFDLVAGESMFADGTEALMQACLDQLGVRSAPVRWLARRFCSPYFSNLPESDDHRDRFPLAWRVEVALATPVERARIAAIMRYEVDEPDDTWQYDPGDLRWDEAVAVVIATFTGTQWRSADPWPEVLRALPRVEVVRWDPGLVQARFEVGRVRLPSGVGEIETVRDACLDLGASVAWQDTLAGRYGRTS